MDAGMGSMRGASGSNISLNKRFAANNNNPGNLNFHGQNIQLENEFNSQSIEYSRQGSGFNQQSMEYNRQGSGFNQQNGMYQPPNRGNTMSSYQQPMTAPGNYNGYSRSNSMQHPSNNYHKKVQQQQGASQKSNFASMFKKKGNSKNNFKDDEDAILMEKNENIVSFNDISGFRKAGGPAYSVNNTSDTSPIIPTILTTGNNLEMTKMNNTSYRKMLTNQKKTALNQYNKQIIGEPMTGMPRAMSMQNHPPRAMSYQNGQQQQFRPPNGIPGQPPFGSKTGTPYGSRSNSLLNINRQQFPPGNYKQPQFQQHPNKAMSMTIGNRPQFSQQPPPQSNNIRANSLRNQNLFGGATQPASYLQQQQQMHGKFNMNQTFVPKAIGDKNENNTMHQDQVQKQQASFNRPLVIENNQSTPPINHDNVPSIEEQSETTINSFQKDNELLEFSHKKSESIKLRPTSALIKGLDNEAIAIPQMTTPTQNKYSDNISHEHKESIVSFISPVKNNDFSSNQKDFYNINDQSETNIFVTASELPFVNEVESNKQHDENASLKTETSKKSSSGTIKKTKDFLKRMSGISNHSRNSSNSKDNDHEFKIHSVVKAEPGNKEDQLKQAAMNRKNYTFKASSSSFSAMSNGRTLSSDAKSIENSKPAVFKNDINKDSNDRRQSYHSLFSNDDNIFSRNTLKNGAIEEEEENAEIDGSSTSNVKSQENGLSDSFSKVLVNSKDITNSSSSKNNSIKANEVNSLSGTKIKSNESDDKYKPIDIDSSRLLIEKDSQLHKKLMQEILLLSEELSESIIRETELERKLVYNSKNGFDQLPQSATSNSSGSASSNTTISLIDAQTELRKKSKTIVQLIKDLNEERTKRFIAEEELVNTSNGYKPNFLEISYNYEKLTQLLEKKDEKIEYLLQQLK